MVLQPTEEHAARPQLPTSMQAWTFVRAGPPAEVLEIFTIPVPTLPTETSVLVRVCSASLHPGGSIMTQLVPFFFRKSPAVPETDFSGVVVAVGNKVPGSSTEANEVDPERQFPLGSFVFGSVPVGSHLKQGIGALAEYVAVDMDMVAQKPSNISFEEASCLPVSGATALTLTEIAKLKTGETILFNAPCGGVGYFACQLARQALGPTGHMIGMCSTHNFPAAKAIGCDDLIDYRTSDLHARFGGKMGFDKIIDAHGSQKLWNTSASYLRPGPEYCYTTVGPGMESYSVFGMLGAVGKMMYNTMIPPWLGGVPRTYQQIASFVDVTKLEKLKDLVEEGKLKVEVGGVWKMEETPKAYQQLLTGHAKGKLVVKIWEP